ncbi:MAG: hypothetical protein HXS48_05240 [Theionarchaea archaeon]|nr:hypothetical protein [Theionarchaea archaeon]
MKNIGNQWGLSCSSSPNMDLLDVRGDNVYERIHPHTSIGDRRQPTSRWKHRDPCR